MQSSYYNYYKRRLFGFFFGIKPHPNAACALPAAVRFSCRSRSENNGNMETVSMIFRNLATVERAKLEPHTPLGYVIEQGWRGVSHHGHSQATLHRAPAR